MASSRARQTVAAYLIEHPDSTITEITAGTSLARSTVTKELKALEKANLVLRTRPPRTGGSTPADMWTPSYPEVPQEAAGAMADEPEPVPVPDGSEAPEENSPPESTDESEPTPEPDDAKAAPQPPATEKGVKLRSGELREQVKVYFAENPSLVVTAGDVARVLTRSSGAVHNAIQVLITEGHVRLDSEPPRRYVAVPAEK